MKNECTLEHQQTLFLVEQSFTLFFLDYFGLLLARVCTKDKNITKTIVPIVSETNT